jgi:hypothetical protein
MTVGWRRTGCSSAIYDGAIPGFHVGAAIALIATDGSGPSGRSTKIAKGGGLSLQLTENGIFVIKEVAYETVAVALVHGEVTLHTGAENTWCQNLR